MSIIELVQSEKFKKIDQFEKRKCINKYILTESNCKIGSNVLCFELETICQNRYYYNRGSNIKIQNMTIGKFYKILDYKNYKVKMINDIGVEHWYTIKRFLGSLHFERSEKLKNLKYVSDC